MRKTRIIFLLLSLTLILSCSGKPARKIEEVFDAQKAFANANELMSKKEYEEARTAFLEIKSRDLTKKYAPMAQLRIADSYVEEQELERAIEEYRKFLDIYPDHRYASYSQYRVASIYFDQITGSDRGYGAAAKALEEFEKLKRMFPRNPYKEIIESRIERCKEIIVDYEFIVGAFYYKKGSYSAAIKRFDGLLKKFPGFKKEPDVLYHLAMSYKKQGAKDKAEEYFKLLIEKYPKSPLIPKAKKELSYIKK